VTKQSPVFQDAGVLDKETGLVWAESPNTTTKIWDEALYYCYNLILGGRKGWRLPTVEELESLVDPNEISPALPGGHPFNNVQSSYYWSSTTYAGDTCYAWTVDMRNGGVINRHKVNHVNYIRPVRGGQ
jgi:hypothetical protein